MPTPRQYDSAAARQAAYRQRLKETRLAEAGGPRRRPVPNKPGPPRWRQLLGEARQALETAAQEMEEVYEQRSERWRESERGEAHAGRVETLRELAAALEELETEAFR